MPALQILHVIASADPTGGGPIEGIYAMSRIMADDGHTCEILCLDPPARPWVRGGPLVTHALGLPDRVSRFLPKPGYGYTLRLNDFLRRHRSRYDAVIIHGLWNYASFGTWRGLRGSSTPYFVYTHGMLDPYFQREYPFKAAIKALYWRLFEHKVLRDAAAVLFTTDEERDLAATSFRPYAAKPLVVGFGTVDVEFDRERCHSSFHRELPAIQDRRILLFLSRIHPKKGLDLLIDAFAREAASQPDVDLVIAGPDQVGLKASLAALAESLGVTARIHWAGMLAGEAKWGAFAAAEAFVLPSHQENFGVAVVEALMMRLPVLITDKVSIWPSIEGDRCGLVVSDTRESVESGLATLLSLTPDQRASMGEAARRCFLGRYDLAKVTRDLVKHLRAAQAAASSSRTAASGMDVQPSVERAKPAHE